MNAEAMETMLKTEGDMFAITNEKPSDPSTFIVPTKRHLNNWNFQCTFQHFVMQVPMYFSTFFIR